MKIKDIKPTAWVVMGFLALLLVALASEKVYAHDNGSDHRLSLGVSGGIVNYPGGVTQRLGYSYGGKWVTDYERLGGKGYEQVHALSVVRRVRFKQTGFSLSLGATYFDGTLEEKGRPGKEIVSDKLTYRLGIDYTWEVSSVTDIRFGILHNSTAGRSERNGGIDRLHLTFDWRV